MKNKKFKFLFQVFHIFLRFIFLSYFFKLFSGSLWYFNGNKIKKTNYVFNERLSKFNLFYFSSNKENIDCLIFGSSISTTLNQKKFKKIIVLIFLSVQVMYTNMMPI